MPLSDWQENCFPEIDGIYEIHVPEHDDPANPRKWRGVIDE